MDEWEIMAAEFDRILKEASEDGMTADEFRLRMTRLSWEMEELDKKYNNGKEKITTDQSSRDADGDR